MTQNVRRGLEWEGEPEAVSTTDGQLYISYDI
jgi:hypothetical protein